jgi:two-component system NtrC family response regulator
MVGSSEPMKNLCRMLARTAPSSLTVLITGESGTGKELVARSIHRLSPRRDQPFVAVNCGAIPESLIESELFGHEKGAFTGATERKIGKFEAADGGTLFLDEIGELRLQMQVKLLRVLEDRRFHRVGGTEAIEVDIRLVCATNRDLAQAVEDGDFRPDLFYRIDVLRIETPPLRQRKSDIETLWEHFVQKTAAEEGREALETRPDVVRLLMRYDWPGNVRELENIARQAVIRRSRGKITPRIVRDRLRGTTADGDTP